MSINEDWDVEKHKVEHEPDEHWELRRKFLLAHKNKFTEDALVCLAQVFVNVEVLGCRYPQETMDLIKELSQEVAAEYREKQKKKLQRTFVEASEAASSKVKGLLPSKSKNTENHTSKTDEHTVQSCKISNKQIEQLSSDNTKKSDTINNSKQENTEIAKKKEIEELSSKRLTETDSTTEDQLYGRLILVERPGDMAPAILSSSTSLSGIVFKYKYTQVNDNDATKVWKCDVCLDDNVLVSFTDVNKKVARMLASEAALEKFRKHCYTIKFKPRDRKLYITVTKDSEGPNISDDWSKDNSIGSKLMKQMGWTGGGLGKSKQGMIEPVAAMIGPVIRRKEGLGLQSNSCSSEMKARWYKLFKNFIRNTDIDSDNDIEFVDFTSEERGLIHTIAHNLGLKSRSYGRADQRRLIVSRKINVQSLLIELKKVGGASERYELVEPTGKGSTSGKNSIPKENISGMNVC